MTSPSPAPANLNFASRIAQNVFGAISYWPEAALGTVPIVAIFISAFPETRVFDVPLRVLLAGLAVVLAIVGAWGQRKKSRKLSDAYEEIRKLRSANILLEERCDKYLLDVSEVLKFALRQLAEECGLANNDGICLQNYRLTIYCHLSDPDCFIPLARIAGNPKHESFGRESYAGDQGIIQQGWENKAAHFSSNAMNDEEWNSEMEERFDIPHEVGSKIRMKSKSLVAARLQYLDDRVGVAVVECLDSNALDIAFSEEINLAQWFPPVAKQMISVRSSLINHIVEKESI